MQTVGILHSDCFAYREINMVNKFWADVWNPWHGCRKYSDGCKNCYVYRRDESVGRDASQISKNSNLDLPVQKKKNGEYKIKSGILFACMTSDFFIEDADEWRADVWRMIKERSDIEFNIITKRIDRVAKCLPDDWGDGYDNVVIGCTMENQKECDYRYPILKSLPLKQFFVVCEPLLSEIDMSAYLDEKTQSVTVGGESGHNARPCNFDWILKIREQCISKNVPFTFKQTGANFIKDGKIYRIKRKYQHSQAKVAGINFNPETI